MRALYLVSKRLPRVCMGGSVTEYVPTAGIWSVPRVHGWFRDRIRPHRRHMVCPACAWVVPNQPKAEPEEHGLPRVCMGGSKSHDHPGGFAFVLRHPTLTPFPL